MAVTLPTITITDDVIAQRVQAAFTGTTDPATGTALTMVQAYKRWLKQQLVAQVLWQESSNSSSALNAGIPTT